MVAVGGCSWTSVRFKVAVRLRSGKDLGAMPLETVIGRLKNEAESRRDVAE